MQPIRVAVGKMPRLLREIIVTSLSPYDDLEVVEVGPEEELQASTLADARIQILMTSCDRAELPPQGEQLLWSQPRLRILAIDSNGRGATLYKLRTHRLSFSEISPDRIAEAIRADFTEQSELGPPAETSTH